MDKATRLILNVIGREIGLSADRVKEEANAGTLSVRVRNCSDCKIKSCSKCSVAFCVTNRTH